MKVNRTFAELCPICFNLSFIHSFFHGRFTPRRAGYLTMKRLWRPRMKTWRRGVNRPWKESGCRIIQISLKRSAWYYTIRTSIFTYRAPLLWSKTTLIASCVRWKWANPPTFKLRRIFLMSLALSVPIFNKKSHWTRAVETFKLWPNFETFHRSCPMIFFVENWHNKSQGHKKKCIHFILGRIFPCLLPHSWELGIDR